MKPYRLLGLALVTSFAALLGGCGGEATTGESGDFLTQTLLCKNGKGIKPFHLDKCANKFSFFSVMTSTGGIKDLIDADAKREVEVIDGELRDDAFAMFEPDVEKKINAIFKSGESGFDRLVVDLDGKKATPLAMPAAIRPLLHSTDIRKPVPLAAVMIAPALTIASGGGSQVWLDDANHFINVGYASGADPNDVKTGRTFGVPRDRGALDASDPFYLTALDRYLASEDRLSFYEALFRVLTASDASSFKALSLEGQAVLTDFWAVYTAELDRHAMSNFQMHPWENDLAEATWVSSYIVSSKMLIIDGVLVEGTPKDLFGVGQNGSGIGVMRNDRRALQRAISKFYWDKKDPIITELAALIGLQKGFDVMQGLASYTTSKTKTGDVLANSDKITKMAAAFLVRIGEDADEITESLLGN